MSKKKVQIWEEGKAKVPAYIVTFSDMITLLLTFFVLLLSMATTKVDEAKFKEGQKSVIEAFSAIGVKGMIYNAKQTLNLGEQGIKYKVNADEEKEEEEQTVDKKEETTRRAFQELKGLVDIKTAQVTGKSPEFLPAEIRFQAGQYRLDEKGCDYIDKFGYNLTQNITRSSMVIYVVGFAFEGSSLKEKQILSAKRAHAAAERVRESFGNDKNWEVFSWGAGEGGQWKSMGPASTSDILIAVLDK